MRSSKNLGHIPTAKVIKLIVLGIFANYAPLALANSSSNTAQSLIEKFQLKSAEFPSKKHTLWKTPKKVLVWRSLSSFSNLQKSYPNIEFIQISSPDEFVANAKDADIYIGYCLPQLSQMKTQLRFIQSMAVGVQRCAVSQDLKDRDVLVSNVKGLSGPEIAEHSIALMMALVRGLDVYHKKQAENLWERNALPGADTIWELEGRTALVIGLGGIGKQIAMKANALGMKVIATRNSSKTGPSYVDYVGLSDELNALAAKSDVVFNTLPLTEKTRGSINKQTFDAMPNHSYYISVGRGATTNSEDLLAALKSRSIAGAGLDVTDPEPLPKDDPLWSQDRVIITPHMAARSDKYQERVRVLVEENFRRYLAGEALLSLVDLKRGY